MKVNFRTVRRYFPLPCMIMIALAPIMGIIQLVMRQSVAFSDFLLQYISPFPRAALALITNIFPFSLAETFLMASPILLTVIVIYIVKLQKKPFYQSVRLLCILLSVLSCAYTVFVIGFAPGYSASTLEDRLELDRKKVSAEELEQTARMLKEECEKLLDEIEFHYGSSSVMPYSLDEMNRLLGKAYEKVGEKYDFIFHFPSDVKYVVMSEAMSYTHITGVYSFFTGEANININFPDYSIPYTAAHEMSHQRGIAREDEANFMAYLVCIESDDVYIRYSGYMNLFEYVFNALYRANKQAYTDLWYDLDARLRSEIKAYNEFFDQYRENVVANVSDKVNNTFLQSNGQTEGTKSYGRVVDLAVAYLLYPNEEI